MAIFIIIYYLFVNVIIHYLPSLRQNWLNLKTVCLLIIYIYSNILSWNIIEKKNIRPRGDSNLRRRSQSTDMLCSPPTGIPKTGRIKPRVKQHCLFPFVQC